MTMISRLRLAALAFALCVAGPVAGEPEAARVAVGDVAQPISLRDTSGGERSLEQVRGEKDLVAVFFRGAW